jgi:hypothetical protein
MTVDRHRCARRADVLPPLHEKCRAFTGSDDGGWPAAAKHTSVIARTLQEDARQGGPVIPH